MCGIGGIIDKGSLPGERKRALLGAMLGEMRHRGPDDDGIRIVADAALGNVRLSIVDLAGGHQPLCNEDGSLWIVFNGEVYNHPELRAGLAGRSHRFATACDTEVILHLFEEYGEECVHRLNGQFAFAIWDARRRELFGARDRLGVRPFYYSTLKDGLVFASTVNSLLRSELVERALDPEGLKATLTMWVPLPGRTVFRGIREVPPGCSFRWSAGSGMRIRPYWDMRFPGNGEPPADRRGGGPEAAAELRELLLDAVRLRLRADVPVGAYVSGGIDSSVIASLVHQTHLPGMTTFSINFREGGFDERPYQDALLRRIGSEHHRITVDNAQMADAFAAVVRQAAQPLLRTAPVPMFFLSRLVRDHGFKVVLTGEGADEFLGGYNIFKENRIRRFWSRQPASRRRPQLLARIYPYLGDVRGRAGMFWIQFFGNGLEKTADPFYSHRVRWSEGAALCRYLHPDHLQAPFGGEEELAAALPAGFMAWDPLARAQYLEAKLFMPNYLLSSQGDRMMMAHSVEGRFPFLDHRVVEFANSLPADLKLNGLNEKFILKKAFERQIPPEIVSRPKQPYRAPSIVREILERRPDMRDRYLSPGALAGAGIFNPEAAGRLVGKLSQPGAAETGNRDNMAFLAILSTQILHEHLLRRSGDPATETLTTADIGI